MKKCKKQQRRLIFSLVNTFGQRHEKMAYQSIINNLVGLGRKVQGLTQQVRNRDEYITSLETQLAEARRVSIFGNPGHGCSVGVGDGTGNLVVHGDYESIKAVQRIILQAEEDRARLYDAESTIAKMGKITTAATDSEINALRAEGVEMFAENQMRVAERHDADNRPVWAEERRLSAEQARSFGNQLRAGKPS